MLQKKSKYLIEDEFMRMIDSITHLVRFFKNGVKLKFKGISFKHNFYDII
jgi:hypothetical protein